MSHRKRIQRMVDAPDFDTDVLDEFAPIVRLWMLRVLIRLNRFNVLLDESIVQQHDAFTFLGLEAPFEETRSAKQKFRTEILGMLEKAELEDNFELPQDSQIIKNCLWCQSELGLSDIDLQILVLVALERQIPLFSSVLASLGHINSDQLCKSIAIILNLPDPVIRLAFDQNSSLCSSGLLTIDNRSSFSFREKIDMLIGFSDRLSTKQDSLLSLFEGNFVRSDPPTLGIENFEYLQPRIQHLAAFLKQSIISGARGVNVLLYGPPGTGKTQCALMLAQYCNSECFEIAVKNGRERLGGVQRLSSYAVSQRILKNRQNTIILFDEVEDIYVSDDDQDFFSGRVRRTGRKGFLNQLLEKNSRPTIWISNTIRQIDPAHLRRFAYCMEMPVPPQKVRAQILRSSVEGMGTMIDPQWCHTIASNEHLSPGMLTSAVTVVNTMKDGGVQKPVNTLLQEVLNGSLAAQGFPTISIVHDVPSLRFRLDALNTDTCPESLIEGLRNHSSARILMHGPSGTGKSQFAKHIADALEMPIMIQRASDLMSPFVGETESNIAQMFRNAASENALLLIDEADTFLHSRAAAARRYEVSMVNEMLTQLESYEGLAILTTNFMNSLDDAVLRRFDIKIEFDYSTIKQLEVLLNEICKTLQIFPSISTSSLQDLSNITPGDFSTVLRQSRFKPIRDYEDLINRLKVECGHKHINRGCSIGFIRAA